MKESYWLYFFIVVGIFGVVLINFVGNLNTSNEQNYYLLKETTEAAMIDAVDLRAYREGIGYDGITMDTDPESMHCITGVPGTIRIVKEKFVESLIRRFAENAELSKKYKLTIKDIDECPPKVTIIMTSVQPADFFSAITGDTAYESDETEVKNILTAILENTIKQYQ